MLAVTDERLRWSVAAGIALVSVFAAAGLSAVDLSGGAGLIVFFLYSIPCEFLVSLAPHDPAVLYLAINHPPLVVALVGGAGTLVAESLNYELLRRVSDPENMLAFYARPEWGAALRAFANVDEDQTRVAARFGAALRQLVGREMVPCGDAPDELPPPRLVSPGRG